MKVVIAATGATLDSQVAQRFGHAPYYLLADFSHAGRYASAGEPRALRRNACDHPPTGRARSRVFVTGNIGPHAFQLIRSLHRQVALALSHAGR